MKGLEEAAEPSKQFSAAVSELRVSLAKAAEQFSRVLHCGNEPVLDCLLSESAPTARLSIAAV
jgi:hypothetical protein